MTDTDHDIATLEARIERLADAIERSRKISLGARALTAAGGTATLFAVFATMPIDAPLLLGGIAAAIGGMVLMGSNRATCEQQEAEIARLEDERRALIDNLALRRVEERPTLH